MAKCLVIGGNGFLGSHLVDELASLGHEVVAFDRFSMGVTTFRPTSATTYKGDFLNSRDLEESLAGQDFVFHFLSTTTPASVENEPRLDIRTNVTQTLDLLDLAVAARIKRVYFASSGGAVYGDQGKAEYSELDATLPISPYGIGKLTIENYLRYYRRRHGLDSLVLRISNPYGIRQHANRRQGLIPIALSRILARQPLQLFGDGTMVRDYAYAPDVVRKIGRLVGTRTAHDTYNIGSGFGHSVNEVFASMRKVTGIDCEIEHLKAPATFVKSVVLNTDRYDAEHESFLATSLEEGIRQTWDALSLGWRVDESTRVLQA
ncbi:NAD-dependent epimerase/dehydratase family protein [Cryobacterium mannosilyticum]|uniref:NAD-dependent epimerase/dehydratase family protein n=1 Tax=Cryobacterium mannosilyticum TaxID=1259190 RepID=A0A4R8W403_9MICO|nr:NAD-dependent epimerase/dehydratase family protein [Cryobacterium mannosilyticum]TFC01219.1 NAD-dependent epimerase/dehydratase family protein [Cryobacterium mannosilyticum]